MSQANPLFYLHYWPNESGGLGWDLLNVFRFCIAIRDLAWFNKLVVKHRSPISFNELIVKL